MAIPPAFACQLTFFFPLDLLFSSIFSLFVFKSVFYSCCVSCEHAVVDCGRRGEVFLTHVLVFMHNCLLLLYVSAARMSVLVFQYCHCAQY